MKYTILFFLYAAIAISVNGQPPNTSSPLKYDVAISFGSMCCGTASDTFLKDYIKKFNCKNKVLVEVWLSGGCGREGEFKILFNLSNLKEIKKTTLKTDLKNLIREQNKKNKASNASSGLISVEEDLPLSRLENCREPLAKWKL